MYESYPTHPWTFNDLQEPDLKENWRDHVGLFKKKKKGISKGEQQSEIPSKESKDYKDLVTTSESDIMLEGPSRSTLSKLQDFRHSNITGYAMLVNTEGFRLSDSNTYKEAMDSPDAQLWKQSAKEEIKNLEEKHTWDIVPLPEGIKPITSRIIFKRKYDTDGKVSRHKARLVARGFQQEEGIDYNETFAAVVKASSYQILFTIAAILGWTAHQMDAKTAFLNSTLDKPVYIRPPQGMKLGTGQVLLVLRALYRLKQSSCAWYRTFKETMESWGWRISAYDPCVFIYDEDSIILQLHVDDMIILGKNRDKILKFKKQISQAFLTTDEGECSWYLGMHVEQQPGKIHLHQKNYVDQILTKYGFNDITPARTPLDRNIKLRKQEGHIAENNFRTEYQSKTGSLNFANNQTQPDISFATGYVAHYASNPNQSHMDAVNGIFAYLNTDRSRGICYSDKGGFQPRGFVDSDFAGYEDSRKSTTGWVFILAGGPVSWSSRRQQITADLTMNAEYVAAAEAAKEAIWIRGFINDLQIPGCNIESIPLNIDSNAALKLTHNPEFHAKSKHIDVKHHFIREKVESKEINTQRVSTKDNLTDILTKSLPGPTHDDLVRRLGMVTNTKKGDMWIGGRVEIGAPHTTDVVH